MDTRYDVIVVGGGGSGLAAAVSAAENGASVILLEKEAQLGGTTGIAVGSFTANRTRMQEQAGIDDHLEAHVEDAGGFAAPEIEARNAAGLRRFFLSHTAETLHWLMGMGVQFSGAEPGAAQSSAPHAQRGAGCQGLCRYATSQAYPRRRYDFVQSPGREPGSG